MDGYKKTVYCYDCGKDITNDYKIGTDNGMICIDCLHNDTVHKGKSYVSLLESTSNLTITGIILAVILIMVANVTAVSQTTEEVSWIIAMISSIGFFFGVKTVVRWISKWPMPLGSFGVVLSCGVRARKALFYKAFAGSYFLSGSVKNRHFLRKWCSKWCSKIAVRDVGRDGNKR